MKLSKIELDEMRSYIEKTKDLLNQLLTMLNPVYENMNLEYHQVNPDLILHMYVSNLVICILSTLGKSKVSKSILNEKNLKYSMRKLYDIFYGCEFTEGIFDEKIRNN